MNESLFWRRPVWLGSGVNRKYLKGPLEIKGGNEHHDLQMVDKDLEVDSEEGLLLKS